MPPRFQGGPLDTRAFNHILVGEVLATDLGEDQSNMGTDPLGDRDCGGTLALAKLAAGKSRLFHASIFGDRVIILEYDLVAFQNELSSRTVYQATFKRYKLLLPAD
jgi:hypothetical protein